MELLQATVDLLWGPWTPWFLFTAGVLFTVWTRFTQYAAMTHGLAVLRGHYDRPEDPGAINHFQALSAALSGTVGLGNIGGVALAIGLGGPGALFWMWVVGFFGMALKTIEITLAMMYRNTDDPENPHGGAMWVVDKVLGKKGGAWSFLGKVLGAFFCITLINSALTGSSMFQSWNVASLTEGYFGLPRIASGILMALLVGLVIIGGIKRIGQVAAKLVPFMCALYILSALAVLAIHLNEIPQLLWTVVASAFRPTDASGAFLGGSLGFAFMQGMKRALYSNEAGQGSAPIAHAAAKTGESAREGIVGGIGPFIDTLCICTLTALVILSTGTWNRPAIGQFESEISLARDPFADEPTWIIQATDDIAALPESGHGSWSRGTVFFLLAEAVDAKHMESGGNVVKVSGRIAAPPEKPGHGPTPSLHIQWQSVVLNEEHWTGVPASVNLHDLGVHREYGGANLTAHAFDREFAGLGKWLVTMAAWLFAISTMITWSYYGEQGIVYLFEGRGTLIYKVAFLAGIIYGAAGIGSTGHIVTIIDLSTGAMLWANLPIVLALGHLAVKALRDYNRRLKAGELPVHRLPPITEGIDG